MVRVSKVDFRRVLDAVFRVLCRDVMSSVFVLGMPQPDKCLLQFLYFKLMKFDFEFDVNIGVFIEGFPVVLIG